MFTLRATASTAGKTLRLNVANPADSEYTPYVTGTPLAPLRCSIARVRDGKWTFPDFAGPGNNRVAAMSDARSSERPFTERLRESMLRWGERSRRAANADQGL